MVWVQIVCRENKIMSTKSNSDTVGLNVQIYICIYVYHGHSKLHVCLDDNDDVHFVLDQQMTMSTLY